MPILKLRKLRHGLREPPPIYPSPSNMVNVSPLPPLPPHLHPPAPLSSIRFPPIGLLIFDMVAHEQLLPALAYKQNPMHNICDVFIHSSMNKERSQISVAKVRITTHQLTTFTLPPPFLISILIERHLLIRQKLMPLDGCCAIDL